MKILRTQEVTDVLDLANRLNTTAYATLIWLRCAHKLNTEVIDRITAMTVTDRFRIYTPEINISLADPEEITFSLFGHHKTRKELDSWLKNAGLTLPKDSTKSGEVDNGMAFTRYNYEWTIGDITYVCSYRRMGAPTSSCQITTHTYQTITCELPAASPSPAPF